MWVDGSDNLYQCGRTYDASYGYYNTMFVKYNSSQANQWYQSWKSNNTYPYGVRQPQIIKTAGTNSKVVGMMNVSTQRSGSYKGRIQVQPMDDSNGTGIAGQKMVYPNNDTTYTSQMSGQPFFSKNVYNDYFATTMPYYDSLGIQMPSIMLWEAESANVQNQFNFNVRLCGIKAQAHQGTAILMVGNALLIPATTFTLFVMGMPVRHQACRVAAHYKI